MPSIPVYPPATTHQHRTNHLPSLLRTPSGLAILEIQGTIHTPPLQAEALSPSTTSTSSISTTPIGRLVFPHYSEANPNTWMKTVHLYVGRHQRLTGEVKRLAKPLAVMRRRADALSAEEVGEDLEIVDVVYYKILFSTRPEPVGD